MESSSLFSKVANGPTDPMFDLKVQLDADRSPLKIDLGAGVYRDENGAYYELSVVKKAKKVLDARDLGHDYELTTGNIDFLNGARDLLFGEFVSQNIATVQTISGTGANHLGALFLKKFLPETSGKVYIGTPTWGNYLPLFNHAGFATVIYEHYDTITRQLNFPSILSVVRKAPATSIFVFQGCCHNPTAMNMSKDQWRQLASEMKAANHFPFIDIAYQGFGENLDDDAFGVRHFKNVGLEFMACQSFSKNMGLYGERVGALHVITKAASTAAAVADQLRCLIRWEFSSSAAYGSRLATIIMSSENLRREWIDELSMMRDRLIENRKSLYVAMKKYKTPRNWDYLLKEEGLFSFLPLSPQEVAILVNRYHIYLPATGRINMAGLSPASMEKVAQALDTVIRESSL